MISFLEDEILLDIEDKTISKQRCVWTRNILDENGEKLKLSRFISGKIPYYYRDPLKIANDFYEKLDTIGLIADICRKTPTTEKFRCSHFGEIIGSIYIEEILGYKILLRKLTQLTAEDTNVHKMDVMCVDTSEKQYKYWWFEVKTSMRHGKVYHRNGIYKQMKKSLENYTMGDKLYDFVQIRDNISRADFTDDEIKTIKKQLSPPGPKINFHGMAVINVSTIDDEDDKFLLTESSNAKYDVKVLTITDLKKLSSEAYNRLEAIQKAAEA